MARFTRMETLNAILDLGLVPVFYNADVGLGKQIVEAVVEGGCRVVEMTNRGDRAYLVFKELLEHFEKARPELILGVGSVVDAPTAALYIAQGANFVVGPTLNLDVIEMAHRYDRPVIPGALTPTEILTAWSAGADIVKVFPANHFGPKYFKDIHGPLPHIKMTPTGGVDLTTAADWIKAGAACIGAGSALVKKDLIKSKDWAALTKLAKQYIDIVAEARR